VSRDDQEDAPSEASAGELSGTVLVVDDERNIRRTLRMVLEGEGARVMDVDRAEAALELLADPQQSEIDVLVMDVRLPGISGVEALERLTGDIGSPVPVILISGHATVSDAVQATRLGAFDFFEKPLDRDRVLVSVRNAMAKARSDRQLERLKREAHGEIIANAENMRGLIAQVRKVGPTKARVLIHGESGTGKELVARAIHDASGRRNGPFVKVNCAAIPRELIESELFGHERGAFTGATAQKKGLFEVASGGTILLDEIGDMDLDAQAKVLRVLQTGEFMRVGGQASHHADARVLAATHRNLPELVQTGEFREDLYFRLNVVPLEVPPLRERPADVALLARHFVEVACQENGVALRAIATEALAMLSSHAWPGNVRELRNVIERMVVLSDGDLGIDDVPAELRAAATNGPEHEHENDAAISGSGSLDELVAELVADGDASLKQVREAVERAYIIKRLREHGWNVSRTAESLGLERTHLHRKMRLLDIQRGRS